MLARLHRLGVQHGSSWLQPVLKSLPEHLVLQVMEKSLNHALAQPIRAGELDFLAQHWLRIAVLDLDLQVCLTLAAGRLRAVPARCQPAAVSFSGALNDLVLIASRQEDPDTLFFQRRLRIEGDTELGLELKNALDSLDLKELPALWRYALEDLGRFVMTGLAQPHENAR